MKKTLEVLFICLILTGTSVDFIARQLVLGNEWIINAICGFIVLAAGFLFYRLLHLNQSTSLAENTKNSVQNIQLTPFKSLVNSNDPFLIIRFFAAFLVFTTHMVILLHPSNDLYDGYWRVLTGGAHAGMAIFFTLSGFLMGKAFLSGRYKLTKEGIVTFYQSRWIRVFPLMTIVFIFLFVLQYPQVLRFDPASILRLLTFNYYGNTIGVNGVGAMWSLSVEIQYYLIAPFVFSIFNDGIQKNKLIGISVVVAIILALIGLKYIAKNYFFVDMKLYDPTFFSLIGNLPYFLTGFIFNYFPVAITERKAKFISNGWVILTVMILFYLICNNRSHSINYFVIISIITGLVIIYLDGLRTTKTYKSLRNYSLLKSFQVLGVLSYGFYLWHSGIGFIHAKLFPQGFATHSSYLYEVMIVGIVTLFISLITYVLVENRFNSYKWINTSQK